MRKCDGIGEKPSQILVFGVAPLTIKMPLGGKIILKHRSEIGPARRPDKLAAFQKSHRARKVTKA